MYTFFVFLSLISGSLAHMRVTYPPARHYDFDWLDDVDTLLPCGMRRDDTGPVTKLEKGQDLLVIWHQSIIHEGGVKIQLLEDDGDVLYNLTFSDEDNYLFRNDTRREEYTVHLPSDFTCTSCILRVRREVSLPFLGYKRDYLSCADVIIEDQLNCPSACSGHGTCVNGSCVCDRTYEGDACQFKDECVDDTDCGPHGRCMDSQGTFYPKLKCFCEDGYFGINCEANPSDFNVDITNGDYTYISLHEEIGLYWRILEESSEIEMVVQAQTNNWIALGWKPADITIECARFPVPRSGYPEYPDTTNNVNPMYCADMVVSMAVGNVHRVRDFYSRDQSTPREDEWYDGIDSLTASTAVEVDGVTTAAFRRKLTSMEQSDHNFTNTDMLLVWARGRQQNDFYHHDEFKGHELGTTDYRGSLVVNFFESGDSDGNGSCYNEYRYPTDCNDNDCQYKATWTFEEETDEIHFELMASYSTDLWVGIGFSEDMSMANSDAIVGWVTADGDVDITDRWMNRYIMPPIDSEDNVYNKAGSHDNGVTTLSFTRKRTSPDDIDDLSFSDSNCLHMLFPVKGGTYNADTRNILIHQQSPVVSITKVCITADCESTTVPPVPTQQPTEGDSGAAKMLTISSIYVLWTTLLILYLQW